MQRKVIPIPATKVVVGGVVQKQSKIRVAAYCRVSTEQEEQLNSFENQVTYYTDYINKNPKYEMAGIYADEGISGTNTKKRSGFKQMIEDCEAGKIDLIITKSISRFARNTQDCLHYTRKLKELNVGVIFEKENISSMEASGELMFTILSSLAQEESRNISENCTWGIRSKFKKGIAHINTYRFMGFAKDEEGRLIIDEEQAKIVRRIYDQFLQGMNPSEIAWDLVEDNVPGVTGEAKWTKITIVGMLKNEKYKGDMLLQKTYTENYLTHRMKKNNGEITQYYVEDSHPPIIEKEKWDAVQLELERRDAYRLEHNIKQYGYGRHYSPFCSKIFCGRCGSLYGRKGQGQYEAFWRCQRRHSKYGADACMSDRVKDKRLEQGFIKAWNSIVAKKDEKAEMWANLRRQGNALEKIRAEQMQEMVKEGVLNEFCEEIVKMLLECVYVKDDGILEFHFLEGSVETVRI